MLFIRNIHQAEIYLVTVAVPTWCETTSPFGKINLLKKVID